MIDKVLMCGNEACGEGAIRAGCKFYAGYPITPQNELTAYMAKRMVEEKKTFIQAESEPAAINMVFGASAAGARAMTSSSSPGISLKQEGISYLAGCELPAVIVNMSRGGPGLGNIAPSQGDYFQATRGGGHGDYRQVVLAPSTVQELFDLMFLAFDLADMYRTPVMLLGDGMLGQMMEPVSLKGYPSKFKGKKDWALIGCQGRKPNVIRSLYLGDGALERLNRRLQARYRKVEAREVRFEDTYVEDAEMALIAFGTTGRICRACVEKLRGRGIKAGLIRPITLWPFPYKHISECAEKAKAFFVVEMNTGQMLEDVQLAVGGAARVEFYGRTGGSVPSEEEILEKVRPFL